MSEYIITTENMGFELENTIRRFYVEQGVVRCRECRFFHIWREPQGQICMRLKFEDGRDMSNGFCAWGERA